MNTRSRTKRLLCALVAVLACALTCVKSPIPPKPSTFSAGGQGPASAAAATGQTFTGRAIKNEEALKLADSVIVGRIVDLGERDSVGAGPGQVYYGNVKVEVVQTIKGRIYNTVTFYLIVQIEPEEEFEETPKTDNTYILFLKKLDPKTTKGIKLIGATEENLSTISTLVRSTADKNQ